MKIFAFGSNGSGQLSIGHTEDVSAPTKCLFDSPAPTEQVKVTKIVAGGNHTLLLTDSGIVYAAGCNIDGRCGPIPSSRAKGQSEENILAFRRVVQVLGHGDTTTTTSSHELEVVDTFKCVSATWEGTILVSSTGDKVFAMGSTPKGELGLGNDSAGIQTLESSVFKLIPDFPPVGMTVVELASGMGHTVAILSNGEVYGWGGSRKGQLGDGLKSEKIVWSPARVEGVPFFATGAVCGREFTVVFGKDSDDTTRRTFMILGDTGNRWGIMDVPDSLKDSTSGNFARKELLDIGASWHGIYAHVSEKESRVKGEDSPDSHVLALTGSLVAWGRNDRGQLPPPNLPPLSQIGVGSEHVLALLSDGSVATFGWGEHGNCGPDTDARGNVAGKYNVVSLPGDVPSRRVVGVWAGCATSWLIVE